MLQPLLSLWGLPPSSTGFLFLFIVDYRLWSSVLPLTPHFLCTSLRFCMVGILPSSLTVGAELSKPFAKYHSVSVMWSCRGTLRLVTSAPRLHFAFGKASAAVTLVRRLKCSEVLPPPISLPLPSWFSSRCSVTATPIPSFPTPSAGTLLLPPGGRSLVAIQKPVPVTPVLLAVINAALAHPPVTPHQCRLHTPSYAAIGYRFLPRHRSGVQVHTLTS